MVLLIIQLKRMLKKVILYPVEYYDGPDRSPLYQDEISQAYLNHTDARTLTFDAYVTFHKLFNDKHDFTAMIGYNQENWREDYSSSSRKELMTSSLPSLDLATGDMNVSHNVYNDCFKERIWTSELYI